MLRAERDVLLRVAKWAQRYFDARVAQLVQPAAEFASLSRDEENAKAELARALGEWEAGQFVHGTHTHTVEGDHALLVTTYECPNNRPPRGFAAVEAFVQVVAPADFDMSVVICPVCKNPMKAK